MQMACGSAGLAASVPSRGCGSPFPGWESSWSLISALGAPFLLVSGPRERLWCGWEGSTLASLLPHTSLLPKKQGLLLLHVPCKAGLRHSFPPRPSRSGSVIYTVASVPWLGEESQESSPFSGSGFIILAGERCPNFPLLEKVNSWVGWPSGA